MRITPENGGRPRILHISNKLINMLNNLPRYSEKVWATICSLKSNFYSIKTRKSLAHSLYEACKLLELGFEYVKGMDGAAIFRKRE